MGIAGDCVIRATLASDGSVGVPTLLAPVAGLLALALTAIGRSAVARASRPGR